MTNNKKEEGKKFDDDKLRMDLLPIEALEGAARALTFGAKKYGDRNWEQGIKFSRVYAALLRHLCLAWWQGIDKDDESGLHPLDHVLACAMFLSTYVARGMNEFDDRKHPDPDHYETIFAGDPENITRCNCKWCQAKPIDLGLKRAFKEILDAEKTAD